MVDSDRARDISQPLKAGILLLVAAWIVFCTMLVRLAVGYFLGDWPAGYVSGPAAKRGVLFLRELVSIYLGIAFASRGPGGISIFSVFWRYFIVLNLATFLLRLAGIRTIGENLWVNVALQFLCMFVSMAWRVWSLERQERQSTGAFPRS